MTGCEKTGKEAVIPVMAWKLARAAGLCLNMSSPQHWLTSDGNLTHAHSQKQSPQSELLYLISSLTFFMKKWKKASHIRCHANKEGVVLLNVGFPLGVTDQYNKEMVCYRLRVWAKKGTEMSFTGRHREHTNWIPLSGVTFVTNQTRQSYNTFYFFLIPRLCTWNSCWPVWMHCCVSVSQTVAQSACSCCRCWSLSRVSPVKTTSLKRWENTSYWCKDVVSCSCSLLLCCHHWKTTVSPHLCNPSVILLWDGTFLLTPFPAIFFFPFLFIRKVSRFYEARELLEECKHLYRFKVGMANSIITHLTGGAKIAPLEWNFKSSPGWKEAGGRWRQRKERQK